MYIKRKYKICSYCGTVGGYFYFRMKLRKNGKRTLSMLNKCKTCHREDENLRQMRLFQKNKEQYLERAKVWKEKNRKKYNESQRKWYLKNKRADYIYS